MTSVKVGDKVTYSTFYKKEKGIVKSFCEDTDYVFVVYHCDNDWDNYFNYTGARTRIVDLVSGWCIDENIYYDE